MQIFSSKDLLEEQLKNVSASKSIKAKPIEPAKSVGITYNAELQRIVLAIRKDINEMVISQIKSLEVDYTADGAAGTEIIEVNDSWYDLISGTIEALKAKWSSDRFNVFANRIASTFVQGADLNNERKTQGEFRKFGIDILTNNEAIREYLKASAGDNARLIKTIPDQYLSQVETIVTTNMRSGNRPSAIVKQLSNQFGVTQRRAKVIARDQTSKINSALGQKRMKAAGVKYFKWVTSKDINVRDDHYRIANRVTKYGKGIFSFDNPPLNAKGVPVLPGDDIMCRCTARPVLQSEIDRNIKAGLTNPKVGR